MSKGTSGPSFRDAIHGRNEQTGNETLAFTSNINIEDSYSNNSVGTHTSTMELFRKEGGIPSLIEWVVDMGDEDELVEHIGLFWEEGSKTLRDYDGVFSLPEIVIPWLESLGYTMDYAKDEDYDPSYHAAPLPVTAALTDVTDDTKAFIERVADMAHNEAFYNTLDGETQELVYGLGREEIAYDQVKFKGFMLLTQAIAKFKVFKRLAPVLPVNAETVCAILAKIEDRGVSCEEIGCKSVDEIVEEINAAVVKQHAQIGTEVRG
jgi:hypothetical protein